VGIVNATLGGFPAKSVALEAICPKTNLVIRKSSVSPAYWMKVILGAAWAVVILPEPYQRTKLETCGST
jgi:hypothetical protein